MTGLACRPPFGGGVAFGNGTAVGGPADLYRSEGCKDEGAGTFSAGAWI